MERPYILDWRIGVHTLEAATHEQHWSAVGRHQQVRISHHAGQIDEAAGLNHECRIELGTRERLLEPHNTSLDLAGKYRHVGTLPDGRYALVA